LPIDFVYIFLSGSFCIVAIYLPTQPREGSAEHKTNTPDQVFLPCRGKDRSSEPKQKTEKANPKGKRKRKKKMKCALQTFKKKGNNVILTVKNAIRINLNK
jgi:hypothetical protein